MPFWRGRGVSSIGGEIIALAITVMPRGWCPCQGGVVHCNFGAARCRHLAGKSHQCKYVSGVLLAFSWQRSMSAAARVKIPHGAVEILFSRGAHQYGERVIASSLLWLRARVAAPPGRPGEAREARHLARRARRGAYGQRKP